MTYQEFKEKQNEKYNEFPLGAAFNDRQFAEMMEKFGLAPDDTDKIVHVYSGVFIRKSDVDAFNRLLDELDAAREQFLSDRNNLYDAIIYEMGNHEYAYTYDDREVLLALGLDEDDLTGWRKEVWRDAKGAYLGQF